MPQVSKIPLRNDVYERIFELLLKLVTDSFSQLDAKEVLEDLLTPTERIMLAKRLAIAILLAKNYSYQDIRKIVCVSPETISRVNVSLRYSGRGYKLFINKILSEEKLKEFWEKIQDLTLSVGAEAGYGSGVWRYLRREVQKKRRRKHTSI